MRRSEVPDARSMRIHQSGVGGRPTLRAVAGCLFALSVLLPAATPADGASPGFEGRSFESWLTEFQDPNSSQHRRTEIALHKIEPHSLVVAAMVDLLQNPESPARSSAWLRDRTLFVLANLSVDAKSALPAVFEQLDDPDRAVRHRAIWALRRIGVERHDMLVALVALLAADDDVLRREAESALASRDALLASVVDELGEQLRNDRVVVRLAVLRVLRQAPAAAAVPVLAGALAGNGGERARADGSDFHVPASAGHDWEYERAIAHTLASFGTLARDARPAVDAARERARAMGAPTSCLEALDAAAAASEAAGPVAVRG